MDINPPKRDESVAPVAQNGADVDLRIMLQAFDALPDATFLFNQARLLIGLNQLALGLCESGLPIEFGTTRCCDMFWRVEGADECMVERAVFNDRPVEIEVMTGPALDRPTILRVRPLRNGKGALTGAAIVTAQDVTELRRAEAEALEQKSFLASLADVTPDEVYTLDRAGRITWMNERAEKSNQSLNTVILGQTFTDFVAEDHRPAIEENLRKSRDGEESQTEIRTVRADGESQWAEADTSPLWREGEVSGTLVFLRDISERRAAQERISQSDKLRAVGELAAGVAHNLNNSLTVIQGRAQLLHRKSTDEATRKSLEIIAQAVDDGSKTLRRILEFARRDSHEEFIETNLAELIDSVVEIARPKWQTGAAQRPKGMTMSVVNPDPVYVLGDAAELKEVVLNLLFNAVDAMPEGGSIEIGARVELESGCFWVADTGCGMSEDVAKRIFEPFYTTKGEKGTGLGLAASHGIVRRHNGTIMVVSEPGEGSRFEVRLPLVER